MFYYVQSCVHSTTCYMALFIFKNYLDILNNNLYWVNGSDIIVTNSLYTCLLLLMK